MEDDEIRRIPDDQLDGLEGWLRWTTEPEIRAVEATRHSERAWFVAVAVMEFMREEPLESEYRDRISAALAVVPGVSNVVEDDREVWAVAGSPDGEELLTAAVAVVDDLADRARAHLGWERPDPSAGIQQLADLGREMQALLDSRPTTTGRADAPFTAAEFTVTNEFRNAIEGRWVKIFAGASATDPAQGGLMIFQSDLASGQEVGPVGYFPTPRRAGPIELAMVASSSVTFTFADGSTGGFSLATGDFE